MRLLVSGDRDWGHRDDPELSAREADLLVAVLNGVGDYNPIEVLIHGKATGADTMAGEWAEAHGIPVLPFEALWHGPDGTAGFQRWAGPVRNQRMLDEGKPDLLVAFHPNIRNSKGTKDMVKKALKAGLPVYLCDSDGTVTTGKVL